MTTIRLINNETKQVTEANYTDPNKATKHFLDLSYRLNLDNPQFTPFGFIGSGGNGYSHKVVVVREDKLN